MGEVVSRHVRRPDRAARFAGASAALACAALLHPAPVHAENDADRLADVRRALEAREYHASESRGGLQAPNRAHNLRTWFGERGIRVHDRTAEGSPELLALTLSGVGRGAELAAPAPGEVVREGNRVEIRRDGLVEWYVNSQVGLEQGFNLSARPAGAGPLVLELALRGAEASLDADAVRISSRTGRPLRYEHLVVRDAAARTLPARLEVPTSRRVRIVVDDAGASYPIVIDPLLTGPVHGQITEAYGQSSGWFGHSVAAADINGDGYDDVLVGAWGYDLGEVDEGVVFVHHGGPSGIPPFTALPDAVLEANDPGAHFGYSVAAAGDVNGDGYEDVIVGAHLYDREGISGGIAAVYLGGASGLGYAIATLKSDLPDANFGFSVAGAGDVNGDGYADVIVGAPRYSAPDAYEGAAFLYLGGPSHPIFDSTVAAARLESNLPDARFGTSVAGGGDVDGDGYADVIVGAPDWDVPVHSGAAFIFRGSAAGLLGSDPDGAATRLLGLMSDDFGESVANAGDVNGDGYSDMLVGAPGHSDQWTDKGAAFLFLGSAAGIADGNTSSASSAFRSDRSNSKFGSSLAGAGDINGDGYADVMIGASQYTSAFTSYKGSAFLYLGSATGIPGGGATDADALIASSTVANRFGEGVACGDVNGDGFADVVVGAPLTYGGRGAVYVFYGGPEGASDAEFYAAAARVFPDQSEVELGFSVAGAGDVNGDGYGDLIVGAPRYDAGEVDEGAAFLFLGGAVDLGNADPSSAASRLESDQAGARLGASVAGAGDVNGDGYADVIVGADLYASGESAEGAAFVFHGSTAGIPNGSPATAATRLQANLAGARLGASVAGAGDVNGDGHTDVIVGAPAFGAIASGAGAAFVFHGSSAGISDADPDSAAARLTSSQPGAGFGSSVAGAGDVDGDGYADLLIGAPGYDGGQGAAFLFHGDTGGTGDGEAETADTRLSSTGAFQLGASVAAAGDVDRDGHADVILGAPAYAGPESDEGAAFVFLGTASGIAHAAISAADARIESDQAGARLGASVAGAGDVDGDGHADVLVGAPGYDAGEPDEGVAFVFPGGPTGVASGTPATADAALQSDLPGIQMGRSVAGAGDLNSDGYADIALGSQMLLVFSGDTASRPLRLRQTRSIGETPVAPWASPGSDTTFAVHMQAWHPGGRGRVALEVEWCPAGAAFGTVSCDRARDADWTDVGPTQTEVPLALVLEDLAADTLYRWRARVLRAPLTITQPGITEPVSPDTGPWRRVAAQAFEADVRVIPEPGPAASLVSGLALLVCLAQRRHAR